MMRVESASGVGKWSMMYARALGVYKPTFGTWIGRPVKILEAAATNAMSLVA